MTRRRSPRLHPQIDASEEGARMTRRIRRRRGTLPAASLPYDDDMLREILLRLPPQPSSLPRASVVCKRWRGLVTDPRFQRQFYAHHRKPPLLGVFSQSNKGIVFNPILDPPDRIAPQRFDLGLHDEDDFDVLDCRHGLVLLETWVTDEVVVCDPIIGQQRRVAMPPDFTRYIHKGACFLKGAMLCAAGDQGHVHGGCHSRPFKVVVLVSMLGDDNRSIACVYSSASGIWGNLISTETSYELLDVNATLVGNALYWLFKEDRILEFDLDGQSLVVITEPPVTNDILFWNHQIVQCEDGVVGFAVLSGTCFQMWQRKFNWHGDATWLLWKTIEMHNILGLPPQIEETRRQVVILGYDEDNGVSFLYSPK